MKIAVIGAGPGGLMASAVAAERASVTLFERNEKAGKKLYITGKGRCNVTNLIPPDEFLEHVVGNPKFLYGAVFSFTPFDTVELLERNGTLTKTERGNRVFPASDKASDVTKALVKNAQNCGVEFRYENVKAVKKSVDGFSVETDKGSYIFDKVVLATGGVSYPLTGSNGDGYKLASSFGHTIVPVRPALVPIILKDNVKSLEGLALKNVTATVVGEGVNYAKFGEMLFTDRGVSGPIILSLSSLINRVEHIDKLKLSVDLKPALSVEQLDRRILSEFGKYKNKQFKNALDETLPKSLIPYIIERSGIDGDKPVNSITKAEREKLVGLYKRLEFSVAMLGDVKEGIVTAGGVSVKEVNPKTMESKLVSGLYFAGEMLDVDAVTGGFNIQIALSTGYVAGKSAGGIQ